VLTPSQRGAAAEAHIAAAALSLGIPVLRPLYEGGRYDLVFDVAAVCFGSNARRRTASVRPSSSDAGQIG
jgi:hypothetical protein